MDEKMMNNSQELEIDLQRLLDALLSKSLLIGIVAVVCAVITFLGTFFFVTPLYQSAAMFYVNNSALSFGEASLSISSADISASRGLVKSYIVILNTRETINEVIDYADIDRTYGQVMDMISAESVNATEIFKVVVTSPDPQEAKAIADAIAYILPKRIASIIEGTSAKIVDSAVISATPSSPNYSRNVVIGFGLGVFLAAAWVILRALMDITIRSEADITQNCKFPILAGIPNMEVHSKGGSDYGCGKTGSCDQSDGQRVELVGGNIHFAAAEAYKLLRTKLQFSFADENDSHIIGLSSALSGEGKSLTAVNLAYTLSQLDKKVLLIDCDMRRPTLAEKLGIMKAPGLSNYLTRQCNLDDLLQVCEMREGENVFHVIAAGQNPPNPVELLSSARMKKALDTARKVYDYVILDLPPVGEVSDAMAIAKETDGMLLVVRQNYCDRHILADTVQQFDFIQAKTLGVVFNCTSEYGGNGYYKKYYKSNYRRYGKNYAYNSYANNDRVTGSSGQSNQ